MPKTTTKKKTTKKTKTPAKTIKEQVNELIENDTLETPPTDTTEITLAQFKKLFKDELIATEEWLMREDKEGDLKNKKMLKGAALSFVLGEHPEYTVTDI